MLKNERGKYRSLNLHCNLPEAEPYWSYKVRSHLFPRDSEVSGTSSRPHSLSSMLPTPLSSECLHMCATTTIEAVRVLHTP